MTKTRKIMLTLLLILLTVLSIVVTVGTTVLTVDIGMRVSSHDDIYTLESFDRGDAFDCVLVLGAGIRDGAPSDMLRDRLDVAIELYKKGVAPKLLMSGDHSSADYDEVNVMKSYAMEKGVPSEDIFMDHAGFSTYESIYRAREVFGAQRVVVVTQGYHLYRALYIGRSFDMDVCGVSADLRDYKGEIAYEIREVVARVKDFFYCIFKPEPSYLGTPIDLSGSGDVTNDR